MIDVLVAGGGPVGLATAIRCRLAGLSVTVAEPRGMPIDKACGEGVMPAAVRRLAALGVTPDGHPLRGICYVDARHQADARFRHGDGLGVRRTVLHAALAARAAALGIPVLPTRVTAFTQDADHVSAAGVEARYLVAADGLHSTIRRAVERGAHAVRDSAADRAGSGSTGPAPQRYGLRCHYRVAPWTDLVEVHWTPRAEAYVTPVSPDIVGVALLFAKPYPDELHADGSPDVTAAGVRTGEAHGPVREAPGSGQESGASLVVPGRVSRSDRMFPSSDREPGSGTTREAQGAGSSPSGADEARPSSSEAEGGALHRESPSLTAGRVQFHARLSAFPALLGRLADAVPASEVRGAGPMRQDVRRRVYGRVLLVGDASGYVDALTGEGLGVGLAQAEALAGCLAAGRPAAYERAWRRASGPAWRFTATLLWSRNQPLLGPRLVPFAQRFPWVFTALVNHVAEA